MSSETLLEGPLKILNITLLNPLKQNNLKKHLAYILLLCHIHLLIEFIPQFVIHWNGLLSLDEFTAMSGIYQIVLKTYAMMFNKEKLIPLLKVNMKKFWKLESYDIPKEYKNEILYIHRVMKMLVHTFGICIAITMIFFYTKPLFVRARMLPFDTYYPLNRKDDPDYEMMYVYQVFLASIGCFGIVGFDTLFFTLIANNMCQLKMIKGRFKKLKIDAEVHEDEEVVVRAELKKLIEHHALVLRCITDLDDTYSKSLLHQFGCSMLGICVSLLGIIVSGFPPNLEKLFKFSMALASLFSQLFMYCMAGALLTEECESLSQIVYETDWWAKTQPKLRRSCVLIIQRANRKNKLAAGGMVTLNLENFTNIVRTSLSFFTLVQAMFSRTAPT